jgi:hypothetical protein
MDERAPANGESAKKTAVADTAATPTRRLMRFIPLLSCS